MSTDAIDPKVAEAKKMIKDIVDDGVATINGRDYTFLKMTHKNRRKVFAYYTHVQNSLQAKDMWFLDSTEFEKVEAVINGAVSYKDSLLSVLGESHWEKYPDDYLPFISVAMGVISYPFLPGNATD